MITGEVKILFENDNKRDSHTSVAFASAQKGCELITAHDDYIARLSPFDLQSKMQTNRDVTHGDFAQFLGENTLEWAEEEKQKITTAIDIFKSLSSDLSLPLPLPPEVFFVKTTGQEEGGAAYTRANAIFFPERFFSFPQEKLNWIVCHEFFHVLTRENQQLREQLYQTIGFQKCGEIELPDFLNEHKITNPDAPIHDHVIEVQADGKDHWAIPLIYSETDFDESEGKNFLQYLVLKLLLVEKDQRAPESIRAAFNEKSTELYSTKEVSGFYQKIGNNTGYIMHAEEILAENFVHMLRKTPDLESPEITEKMREILKGDSVTKPHELRIT